MQPIFSPIHHRKIRFALVGCGRIAQNHIDAIQSYPDDTEIVSVCDMNPIALDTLATQTQAKGYLTLPALLDETTADVIVLATPSGLHANQTIAIANAKRHVVTEKPMATKWQDGLRMVKSCDDANVHLFVVKQNRHNPTLQLLKNALTENRFGQVYMVNVNVFWTRPQTYYDSAHWRGTWEFDGGAFMNQASHYVDLLDWLIGPIESVQAYMGTLGRRVEVEDTGVMSVKWRSGALGSLNVTMLTYPQNLEGSITILGEKGTVRIGGIALNEIQHWEFESPTAGDSSVDQANYSPTSVYGLGHKQYYQNVIQVLRGDTQPHTDGRAGLKSLEILIAAYLSARDGKRISLPLDY